MMEIMDIVDKKIKVGNIAYMICHNVHGNPNGPLNEPKVYEINVAKYENGCYDGTWTKGFTYFTNIPEKLVHATEEDAQNYINEHRDEIIKESFEQHEKWFKEQLKRARKPLF